MISGSPTNRPARFAVLNGRDYKGLDAGQV